MNERKTVSTYLRLSGLQVAFLINFNEAQLRDGLQRIVNGVEVKPFKRPDLRKGAERLTGARPRL